MAGLNHPNRGIPQAVGPVGRLCARLDDLAARWAAEYQTTFIVLLVTGLLLIVAAYLLDVLSVPFDGALRGGAVILSPPGAEAIVTKQVGYGFAPNWALTGFVLLPYAVMQALKARYGVEGMIGDLIDQRMLVTDAFGKPDPETVLGVWRRRSRGMMPLATLVVVIVMALVVWDFVTVVAQWDVASDAELRSLAAGVDLHHGDYEFDWSVAAAFAKPPVAGWADLLFAGIAYLVVAAFGAAFLYAAFFYFLAFGNFFSRSNLKRSGLLLVPNPRDEDPRCGFGTLAQFFEPFVLCAAATALIALAMYLQNLYLRAPGQEDIVSMVFQPVEQIIGKLVDSPEAGLGALADTGVFTSIATLTGIDFSEVRLPLQVVGSAVGMLLLVIIVLGYVWYFLRESAVSGRDRLLEHGEQPVAGTTYSADELARIHKIQVWPVGWISVNLLLACIGVVIASMWWPGLVALILAMLVYRALRTVYKAVRGDG